MRKIALSLLVVAASSAYVWSQWGSAAADDPLAASLPLGSDFNTGSIETQASAPASTPASLDAQAEPVGTASEVPVPDSSPAAPAVRTPPFGESENSEEAEAEPQASRPLASPRQANPVPTVTAAFAAEPPRSAWSTGQAEAATLPADPPAPPQPPEPATPAATAALSEPPASPDAPLQAPALPAAPPPPILEARLPRPRPANYRPPVTPPVTPAVTLATLPLPEATPAATPVAMRVAQNGHFADGIYTGPPVDAYYGLIQIQAIVQGGRLSGIRVLRYPSDRWTSVRINRWALPILRDEVISAQSARVDIISGATLTSEAFIRSIDTALSQAGA